MSNIHDTYLSWLVYQLQWMMKTHRELEHHINQADDPALVSLLTERLRDALEATLIQAYEREKMRW